MSDETRTIPHRRTVVISVQLHEQIARHLDTERAAKGRMKVPTLRQFTEQALRNELERVCSLQ